MWDFNSLVLPVVTRRATVVSVRDQFNASNHDNLNKSFYSAQRAIYNNDCYVSRGCWTL